MKLKAPSFLVIQATLFAVLSSCSSSSETTHGNAGGTAGGGTGVSQQTPTPSVQALTVYEGNNLKLNEVSAVNVTNLNPIYDFTYQADQDEALTITHFKDGLLVGCDDNDISYSFNLYRVGDGGELSNSLGLGFTPTTVQSGYKYIARIELKLDKSCLGLGFSFGIQITPVTPTPPPPAAPAKPQGPAQRCELGCYVAPKCEAFAQMEETKLFPTNQNRFVLTGTDVITENPHPSDYQLEYYRYGTDANPGHLIVISYGYQDTSNPQGDCRVETVDSKPLDDSKDH